MNKREKQAYLKKAEPAVERAIAGLDATSKQPRFDPRRRTYSSFFRSWYKLTVASALECPAYGKDWVKRDSFLSQVWKIEPHWSGVLKSVAAIDANRGWQLIGGRNQVNRYKQVMHNHVVAPDIMGHYEGMEAGSIAFHTSDIQCIKEVARDVDENGPVRGFLHVPPTVARLTGSLETPLEVSGAPWSLNDYFRVTSLADVNFNNPGYGYCSTSIILEVMKIMVAVTCYKQEKLAARLPVGFLVGSGIEDEQFSDAMQGREAVLDGKRREVFGGLAVLLNPDAPIELKLISLASLPDNFDEEMFTKSYMNLAALVVSYDPAEFWPTDRGSFGNTEESRAQRQKASGKGEKTFILRYFEKLRAIFPKTLELEPDERDDRGELTVAEINKAQAGIIMSLYDQGIGIVDRNEARSLAAEAGLIPRDWTIIEEEAEATDTTQARLLEMRERARSSERVRAAAGLFWNEPIVCYRWPSAVTTTLYTTGAEYLRPRYYPVARTMKRETLHQGDGFIVTDEDVQEAIEQAETWAKNGLVPSLFPEILQAK